MDFPDAKLWRRLSPLVDRLLDLDGQDRASELATLRAQDPSFADALEDMFARSPEGGTSGFLAGSVLGSSVLSPPLVGSEIGEYVIDALLGHGGGGSVWRAHHRDADADAPVAIKLLHLTHLDRSGANRFQREGIALARLSHRNIARLLESGITAARQPYLILEFVEGEQIDRYCATRCLSVENRLALFNDVLAAVANAHSHLIVHRDIKSSNILVTNDGTVKLLDFGVAKLLDDNHDATTLTVAGQAMTLRYAAPEQLKGGVITTATDIYALGILLCELLVGQHPLYPSTSTSIESILRTIDDEASSLTSLLFGRKGEVFDEAVRRNIALERATTIDGLRLQLADDLESIVARALRKDPALRYQTATSMSEDLIRHRIKQPVLARPDGLAYQCAAAVVATGWPIGSLDPGVPGERDELLARALDQTSAATVFAINAACAKAKSASDAVIRASRLFRVEPGTAAWNLVKLNAATAIESERHAPIVRRAVANAFTSWAEAMTNGLKRHGIAADDAERLGWSILVALEGALIVGKATGSALGYDIVTNILSSEVARRES